MFPAAIAIVVVTFDLRSRGRALALFFGIAGGLTAIGPIAGGYLIEWTWRAIFWINIPVALIALALIAISRPPDEARPAPMDYRGLALIVGGVGLSVFGFQQSALWGWGNPAIWVSIAVGVLLLIVFSFVERRTESPLINVRIFENRTFLVENVILGIAMMAFIPVFFFASHLRADRAGREGHHVQPAHLVLLHRLRGVRADRRPDAGPDRRQAAGGAGLRAGRVGFGLWAGKVTDLHAGAQVIYIVIAGAGMGLMLGQANTDAINRASRYSYGEATGITQTVRNYGASLGFAILGTLLITEFRSRITSSLTAKGLPGPPPRPRPRRSPSCRAATATSPPSRSSSAPTSPRPPGTCSTGCASSWPSPRSWPCAVSSGASSRSMSRPTRGSVLRCPARTQTSASPSPKLRPVQRAIWG